MATLFGKNFNTPGGGIGSAGDNSTAVDRPNEGLPGVATTYVLLAGWGNTRGNFDTYKATGLKVAKQVHIIDTTGTNYADPWQEIRNALPTAWANV